MWALKAKWTSFIINDLYSAQGKDRLCWLSRQCGHLLASMIRIFLKEKLGYEGSEVNLASNGDLFRKLRMVKGD